MVIVAISYDSRSLNRRMATLQGVGHIVIPASSLASGFNAIQTGNYHILLIGSTVSAGDRKALAKASRQLRPHSKIVSVDLPGAVPLEMADRHVPAGDEMAILGAVSAFVSGNTESDSERGRR